MLCLTLTLAAVAALIFLYKKIDVLIRKPLLGSLHEKYIFVTGCDSGFGKTTAKHLDSLGVHVIAGCFTEEGRKNLKEECSSRLNVVHLDITDIKTIEKAFEFVKSLIPKDKGLWGLLNNAGTTGSFLGPPSFFTLDDYKEVLNVNLFGMIEMNRVFLPLIKKARGRFVNTASIGGRFANPYNPAYAVSKFAVEGYSDVLRREMRPFKVGVAIIEPAAYHSGFTDVEMVRAKIDRTWERQSAETKKEYGQQFVDDLKNRDIKVFMDNISDKSFEVTEAYTHALLGKFPRGRYMVPGINGRMLWFLSLLPEWMSDSLLERGVPNRAIPAACKQH